MLFVMQKLSVLSSILLFVNGFNLSPKPNVIFKEPKTQPALPEAHTSYFGYSLNLRESSVYVGAPRAQSSLPSQLYIKEPGVIYKCSLKKGGCTPFNFDSKGNIVGEWNDFTWDSENKDNQWLGATMDGGPSDKDRMVVCAPRFFANSSTPEGYLIHGICYVAENTLGDQPAGIRKISPLRLKRDQTRDINGNYYFYNAYAQMGFSLHNVDSRDEIIFGAPGLATWKGSMVRYRVTDDQEQEVSRNRRDTHKSISKRELKKYESETLAPELWGQSNDTYFGYAVSSGFFHGPNSTELLYLATAPQSDSKDGEAYLFSIEKSRYGNALTIGKRYLFEGTQFGEYFGYSILAEDVNGDNYTDVIISAPNYYLSSSFDNGAIYVFLNLGNVVFTPPTIITSGRSYRERFGSTLTKLGDINLDGYNDIAVGAPFSGNGVVYIYLGGPNGLRAKASQIIESPASFTIVEQPMFGFGLSKGVDIDLNGYNDLAIGEPGDDSTYIYRSYPVVKILTTIEFPSRQIQVDQKKIQIKICWQLQTKSKTTTSQDVNFSIRFDPLLKRVQVSARETNFKALAKPESQCKIYDATVKVSVQDIFRPIEIEAIYELTNKIPETNSFCDTCAVVDPSDPKSTIQKIAFMTGCKTDRCVADLKIKSVDVKSPFIIGSSDSILVKYTIHNNGENAYLPQINVTSSNKMHFTKIPSTCNQMGVGTLECNLNDYRPLGPQQSTSITIGFDSSNIQVTKAVIRAQAISVGVESNPKDNIVEDVIMFAEFSQIEASGKSLTPTLSLEDGLGIKKIKNLAEIRNHGPSVIKQLEVTLKIPLAYVIEPGVEVPLIDFNNITLIPRYNNRKLDVVFMQNGSILIPTTPGQQSTRSGSTQSSVTSKKLITANKNIVLRSITEKDYQSIATRKVDTELAKEISGTLPINRTVFLNCHEDTGVSCVDAKFSITNLVKNDFLNITFDYSIDLDIVNKILIPEKDFFLVTTVVEAIRTGDTNSSTIQLVGGFPNNVIAKHHPYGTPVWVIILSVIGGLLIFVGITYGMYKMGFFKRDKLQELQAAKHETQPLNESSNRDTSDHD